MVKYLRTERFTNRNVDIKVELYEMDMAIVDITVKPAYWYYQRLCCRMNLPYGCRARFDYCKHEALWEYVECLNLLRFDKVARRWLRRVMRPIVAPYVMPNGKMNYRKATDEMERRKCISTIVCTNERMLALTQELVPDFYALLQRERKLNDCRVKMRFTWREGLERPLLDIIVTDNDSPSYEMEEPREERYGVYHELSMGTIMNYGSLYL